MLHDVEDTMILQSVITCPHCATQRSELMPTDACRFFYTCTGCGAMLRPKAGDCCVFCCTARFRAHQSRPSGLDRRTRRTAAPNSRHREGAQRPAIKFRRRIVDPFALVQGPYRGRGSKGNRSYSLPGASCAAGVSNWPITTVSTWLTGIKSHRVAGVLRKRAC